MGGHGTFSILSRIDLTATPSPGPPGPPHLYFQYPLPDRPHCNWLTHCDVGPTVNLSVSSPGSTSLQPFPPLPRPRPGVAFSILSRIDLTATPRPANNRQAGDATFSILSRIDLTATPDRRRPRDGGPAFSILSRIDLTATSVCRRGIM